MFPRVLLPLPSARLRNMARLRIVTWNCGMALARKAPSLLALNPDIAVVQECSKKSVDVLHGHGLSGLWFGANPNKGLAVLCSTRFQGSSGGRPLRKMGGSRSGSWVERISTCSRSGLARSERSVLTITSGRFTDASWNIVVGSPRHPLSPLETSTAMCNGTRTAPVGTTPR